MTSSIESALTEAKQSLADLYGERLVRLVLYGSQARGDAGPDSDVDILVVLRGEIDLYSELKRLTQLKLRLLELYDVYISMQPFTVSAYEDRRRPFMRNVHREGVDL